MQAYGITYKVGNDVWGVAYDAVVDAKSLYYAVNKLARKHKVDRDQIVVIRHSVVGYY